MFFSFSASLRSVGSKAQQLHALQYYGEVHVWTLDPLELLAAYCSAQLRVSSMHATLPCKSHTQDILQ